MKFRDAMEEWRRSASYVAGASLVSGAVSGMLGVAAAYPLELVRVRLQVQPGHSLFLGPWDCLRKTVRGEGVRGLYKGMASPLIGATLTKTVNFGTFGFLLASLREQGGERLQRLKMTYA